METSNSNIIKNDWNDDYVNLASGLGLSLPAKCERQAAWTEWFVLGYLISRSFSEDYAEKGYVEKDSCVWSGWGFYAKDADVDIALNDVNIALHWLNYNEFIEVIWLEGPGTCYKVSNWVLEKVAVRYADGEPWRMFDE